MGAGTARRALKALGWVALALLLVPTACGWLGFPMLSYAKSGSMEPAIRTGQAYLSNPFARDYAVGDIAVFESEVAGGYAVHRLVAREGSAWITKGDANPQTDQDVGEPFVEARQIRARVLTREDGSVVTVPFLGEAALQSKVALRGLSLLTGQPPWVVALALASVGGALLAPGKHRHRAASPHAVDVSVPRPARPRNPFARLKPWHLRSGGALFVLAAAVLAAHFAQEEVPLTLVVTDSPPPGSLRSTTPGGTLPRELLVGAAPWMPGVAVVELPPRVALERGETAHTYVARGGTSSLQLVQTAGAAPGLQEDTVVIWHYPPVLPPAHTRALHDVAPGALTVALGVLGAAASYAGTSGIRSLLLRAPTRPGVRP